MPHEEFDATDNCFSYLSTGLVPASCTLHFVMGNIMFKVLELFNESKPVLHGKPPAVEMHCQPETDFPFGPFLKVPGAL